MVLCSHQSLQTKLECPLLHLTGDFQKEMGHPNIVWISMSRKSEKLPMDVIVHTWDVRLHWIEGGKPQCPCGHEGDYSHRSGVIGFLREIEVATPEGMWHRQSERLHVMGIMGYVEQSYSDSVWCLMKCKETEHQVLTALKKRWPEEWISSAPV